jgi:hypothetical protein
MATTTSLTQALLEGPAYGQPLVNRLKTNRFNGRIRFREFTYRAPASGALPAIADKIVFGKLPPKATILGHLSRLSWSTGTASCTLNLGDNTLAARHLAATAITTAGNATPEAANLTTTMTATTVNGSAVLSLLVGLGAAQPGDVLSGTGITTGTYVLSVDPVGRTLVMSAAATADGTAIVITSNGGSYETQDDTANAGNSYVSALDDCTLIGTVAGAQIANNQVITLKVAYVMD